MLMVTAMAVILMILATIMISVSSIISKKSFNDREKSSPFECGFDPKSSSRMPFSLQFFLIAVIFLIFDVEISLLIPMITTMGITSMISYTSVFSFFIIILLTGLYHEWNQGALNWAS